MLVDNGPEKGAEKRPQKMEAKRVQPQSLDPFCFHFLEPLFGPLFGAIVGKHNGPPRLEHVLW